MSKFKVGDRVRVVDSSGSSAYTVGEEGVVAKISSVDFEDHTQLVELEGKNGSAQFGGRFELISPALTIQAGKFYKTRDGRKVGPMVFYSDSCDNQHPWESDGYLWQNDGTNYDGPGSRLDLIAEWAEPVAAWKVAKVGYRIKVREGGRYFPGQTVEIIRVDDLDDEMRLKASDDEFDLWVMNEDVVAIDEPVAVAPATATFKVGDRVRFTDKISEGYWFKKGETGVISNVSPGRYHVYDVTVDKAPHGHYAYVTQEMVQLIAESATSIKVGDWVRTDDGDIGIVLHDDGTVMVQFKVGFVGDEQYDDTSWFSDLQLTVVPPGTTKAANDNAPILAEIDELEQRLTELRGKLAA